MLKGRLFVFKEGMLDNKVEDGSAGTWSKVKVAVNKDTKKATKTKDAREGFGATEVVRAGGGASYLEDLVEAHLEEGCEECGEIIVKVKGRGM